MEFQAVLMLHDGDTGKHTCVSSSYSQSSSSSVYGAMGPCHGEVPSRASRVVQRLHRTLTDLSGRNS